MFLGWDLFIFSGFSDGQHDAKNFVYSWVQRWKKIVMEFCLTYTLTTVFFFKWINSMGMNLLVQSLKQRKQFSIWFSSVTEVSNFVFQSRISKHTMVKVHNLCSLNILLSIRLSMTHQKHLNPEWWFTTVNYYSWKKNKRRTNRWLITLPEALKNHSISWSAYQAFLWENKTELWCYASILVISKGLKF